MMTKSKYKGKYTRTSGWQSQIEYDKVLSDLDVSSLVFFKESLYPSKLREFRNTHDLNDEDNKREYKEMQQRLVMINEELEDRMHNINASKSYTNRGDYFDPVTGLVLDENGRKKYGIAFNEDEDDCLYDHTNNTTSHPTLNKDEDEEEDETDYENYKYHTRKGVYSKDWNTSISQYDNAYQYQDDEDVD